MWYAVTGDARDPAIALFEAGNWIHSLDGRVGLTHDARAKAFIYVRKRTHHQFADARRRRRSASGCRRER
jgi:hypothetical protein